VKKIAASIIVRRRDGSSVLRRLDHFQFHARDAGSDHLDLARGGEREIDDASIDERSAIGDPDVYFFSVLEIGDFHPGLKRKSAMRRGELFHVVDLAGRRASSVVRNAVPAREAGFGGADFRGDGRGRRSSRDGAMRARRADGERRADHRNRINRASKHLKQFYANTFRRVSSPWERHARRDRRSREVPVVHFFLDFQRKEPYKGDTTALSHEWREI